MQRRAIVVAILCALVVGGCSQPQPEIQVVVLTAEPLPTYTPYPTLDPLPTYTLYPTYTLLPSTTPIPIPSETPEPTAEPTPDGPYVNADEWSWHDSATGRYIEAQGLILNISNRAMRNIEVQISLRNANKEFLSAEWTYADPEIIQPGQQAMWQLMAENRADLEWVKIENITWEWVEPPTTPYVVPPTETPGPTSVPTDTPTPRPTPITLGVGDMRELSAISVKVTDVRLEETGNYGSLCQTGSPLPGPYIIVTLELVPKQTMDDIALSNAIYEARPIATSGTTDYWHVNSLSCANSARVLIGEEERFQFPEGQPIKFVSVWHKGTLSGTIYLLLPDGSRVKLVS